MQIQFILKVDNKVVLSNLNKLNAEIL